jgi:hypothetical protein
MWYRNLNPSIILRIGVCLTLIFSSVGYNAIFLEQVSPLFYKAISFYNFFPYPVLPKTVGLLLYIFWKIALFSLLIGFKIRISAAISFLLSLYFLSVTYNFGNIAHNTAMIPFVLLLFAIIPKEKQRNEIPKATAFLLMIMFFTAGIQKLRFSGFDFISSDYLAIRLLDAKSSLATSWPIPNILGGLTLILQLISPLLLLGGGIAQIVGIALFIFQAGVSLVGADFTLLFPLFVIFLFKIPRYKPTLITLALLPMFLFNLIMVREDWPFSSFTMFSNTDNVLQGQKKFKYQITLSDGRTLDYFSTDLPKYPLSPTRIKARLRQTITEDKNVEKAEQLVYELISYSNKQLRDENKPIIDSFEMIRIDYPVPVLENRLKNYFETTSVLKIEASSRQSHSE